MVSKGALAALAMACMAQMVAGLSVDPQPVGNARARGAGHVKHQSWAFQPVEQGRSMGQGGPAEFTPPEIVEVFRRRRRAIENGEDPFQHTFALDKPQF